jgi:hypothetical protein
MAHDKTVPVEDDLAARRLVARYAQLVDDRNFAAAAALFTADGRVVIGGEEHVGPAGVEAWLSDGTTRLGAEATVHDMSNVVISYGSQPDSLHAVSDMALLVKRDGGWGIGLVARYHDTFVGHGREVLFRQRVLTTS